MRRRARLRIAVSPARLYHENCGPARRKISGGRGREIRTCRPLILRRASFLVLVQEAALLQVLALEAVPGPRHGVQALLGQGLAAVDALAVLAALDALQRLVNQL